MSRNVGATPALHKGASWTSHFRQYSRTSLDVSSADSPKSPGASSTHSSRRPDSQTPRKGKFEQRCTVTVNENYSPDEVLLNLDLIGTEVKPGVLMSMTVIEPDKPSSAAHATLNKQPSQDGRTTAPAPLNLQGEGGEAKAGKRYVFVVKDMSKELKGRYPNREVYVVKHIADSFGMRNRTQVVLNLVRTRVIRKTPTFGASKQSADEACQTD